MKRISLIIIFICAFLVQISAKEIIDPGFVDVVEVVDKDLVIILDNIVDHEKRCNYYDPDLVFSIIFCRVDNKPIVIIGTTGTRVAKNDDITGCFYLKNHFFLVINKLPKSQFKRTSQKLQYNFAINQTGMDTKTGIFFMDSMSVMDDSYSYWTYRCENNKLIFLEQSTFCK